MKKKAVFFTFIAVFIVVLLIAVSSTKTTFRYREKSESISQRVHTLNVMVDDFSKDYDRALFIAGYRGLLSMNSYVRDTQGYIGNVDDVFYEILLNGTANSSTLELMSEGVDGASLNDLLDRVNEQASNIGFIITHNVTDVHLYQESPWSVKIKIDSIIVISDIKGAAKWSSEDTRFKEISIIGFEDPLYIINTDDKVTNLINITPDYDFVFDATNDSTVLEAHLTNSFYIASNESPSFLMRYTGNMSASQFGIESMVNLEELNAQNIPLLERSVIDYIYFGTGSTSDLCNVTGMSSWFRIDEEHEEAYEVDRLESASCT